MFYIAKIPVLYTKTVRSNIILHIFNNSGDSKERALFKMATKMS